MDTNTDVLVVGAGPTGLVLAIELARRGVTPRVIDSGPADVHESRAVAVVARSLEILDDLGLADAAVQRGVPLHGLNLYQGTTALAEMDLTAVDSPFPMDLCIPQWQTVGLLRERARALGITIEWNTRLVTLRSGADEVTAEIVRADGTSEHCHAQWLAGCDGSHSAVRRAAGIGWRTEDLRRGFILGDVSARWPVARDRFHAYFGRTGVVALFPMPGGYWRVLASTPDDNPPRPPRLTDFTEAVAAQTPLDSGVYDLRWSSAFVAREGLAERFREGRVVLAGDAAHSHSPIGGQGMNVGMQDAYNLGWKLALTVTGRTSASIVDSYQVERRPVAETVVGTTSTATRVATNHTLLLRRARRHALRLFGRLNSVQQRLSNALGEYLVDYGGSPIVSERWQGSPPPPWSPGVDQTGPHAGALAPDAYVELRSGPVALRHVYRDPGHHLLLFAADENDPDTLAGWKDSADKVMAGYGQAHLVTRGHLPERPADGVFADPRSEAHNRHAVRRPSVYLVRPDKYIGYRGDSVDFSPVREYFQALAPTA